MKKEVNMDLSYKSALEENFLTHIGYEYAGLICEQLDTKEQYIREIEVPESLDTWFAAFLKQKRRKKRRMRLLTYAKRAAAILIVLFGINYILVSNVDAYRIRWLNIITGIQKQFTQIDMVEEEGAGTLFVPDDWAGNYYLSYLPAGYQLSDSLKQKSVITLVYTNSEGKQIIFNQFSQNSSSRIDSEGGEVSDVLINGDQKAIYLQKKDSSILSWVQEGTVFQISGMNISLKELIQIAEGINLQKK